MKRKPRLSTAEAYELVKNRRAKKNLSNHDIAVPRITGKAAVSLANHMKSLDNFKARSLSKSGGKVIR